jgi:hypothetical protein
MPTVPCLIKYSVNDFTEEQVTQFRNLMVEDYHELNSKVSKSLSCLQVSLASLEAIAEQMCSGKLKYLRKLRELRGVATMNEDQVTLVSQQNYCSSRESSAGTW